MKVVIIGGITAGLSAASQIKREDHSAQVIVLEKSGDVSYAACGMTDKILNEKERQELMEKFELMEKEIGPDVHRRFEQMAATLAEKYR